MFLMMSMRIKTSYWTLLAALLFTINTIYWYWKYSNDVIGIIIFGFAAVVFYIATVGNWKSGN